MKALLRASYSKFMRHVVGIRYTRTPTEYYAEQTHAHSHHSSGKNAKNYMQGLSPSRVFDNATWPWGARDGNCLALTWPHLTAPNRMHSTAQNHYYSSSLVVRSRFARGTLLVRSWFALDSLAVLSRYGTVTVRYFNFFLTGTVHMLLLLQNMHTNIETHMYNHTSYKNVHYYT